jgi:hypothetical protein
MTRCVITFEIFAVGILDAHLLKALLKVLELFWTTDFLKAQHIRVDCIDHPGDSGPLGFRFADIGAKLTVDAARHPQIVFYVVAGDPDFIGLMDGVITSQRSSGKKGQE